MGISRTKLGTAVAEERGVPVSHTLRIIRNALSELAVDGEEQ